ncbi:MAG: dienelactone hydrolase family protein [Acidobacteria bacterium]|nr:dienelactone hydrolase family protein [Acidobacteriota bacterium]
MYDGMLSETINIQGHGGDMIPAYLARPMDSGPHGGVVVIHHMPGWDEGSKEITRTFARNGYLAICPHLHHRDAPGATPDEAAAAARAAGGPPDGRVIGDVGAAAGVVRACTSSNGKVGVIGYCSGGRHAYLAAAQLTLDAVVDCYGGNVVMAPDQLSDARPISPIDLTAQIGCPLLGLFGAEDRNPSPEMVAQMEAALQGAGKDFELHSYEGAGHAFFSVHRPNYRVEAAVDGWQKVFEFFGRHLA